MTPLPSDVTEVLCRHPKAAKALAFVLRSLESAPGHYQIQLDGAPDREVKLKTLGGIETKST